MKRGGPIVDWYEEEVRFMERAADADPGPIRPVAFYGSSSIRLWSTLADDLGDARIVNLGFGGSTLAACAHFFERLVVPRRPASLVLYAGDNDLGDGRSARDVFGSFRALVDQLDAHLGPIPFAYISIKPSPARRTLIDEIRSANEMILGEVRSRPNSDYIDVFTPMLGPDGRPRLDLYVEDGLHLSRAGYDLWADQILMHRDAIL
jgi:lysophospholipase L1-like esterase